MFKPIMAVVILSVSVLSGLQSAKAEILAMMNYETKSPETIKALKLGSARQRVEGIAIVNVDPRSKEFGKILLKIPLPADLTAHHIFYDRTMRKAYITALGKLELRVMDLTRFPYRIKVIDVPSCKVGEDVTLSEDNKTWYLTCMGSDTIVVGDVASDKITAEISTPKPYPHGLAVNSGIDRALVTNTIRPDLKEPGEYITVIEASTNKALESIKVSKKASPSGVAPVEILFVPKANPPVAYVTNMFGHALWGLKWNPKTKKFGGSAVYDFTKIKEGIPLEMYFNAKGDRLYITTAKPGALHIFDVSSDPMKPRLLKSLKTAEGAHHVAITKDETLAFVQNALLNLPGMSDGSVTVIDLISQKKIASMETLKNQGLNPNSIVLLPEWNSLAGH